MAPMHRTEVQVSASKYEKAERKNLGTVPLGILTETTQKGEETRVL